MRKVLIGFLVLVVLLVAAALFVPGMIDWNTYKDDIAAQVKAATGRQLTIDGNLDFSVLPTPQLLVNNARLANISGASAPDMVRLKSLRVRIRLAPLLQGRVEVESVTLVEPVIRLETLAGGRANWEFSPPGTQTSAARTGPVPERRDPTRSAPADADAIRLDSLRIVNGTLVYRDAGSDTVERIEQLNAEVSAGSLAGPFRAKGTLLARRVPIEIDTAIGRITEGAATPITLRVKFTNADAQMDMTGTVAEIATAPRMSGRLKLFGDDFALFAAAFGDGKRSVSTLPPWTRQKFALDVRVKASAKEATATDLLAELGDVRATGGVTATFGGRVGAKIRLKINRVDLDRWLTIKPKPPAAGGKAGRGKAGGSGKAASSAKPSSRGQAETPFRLPKNIDASLDFTITAVKYLNGQIRDIRLAGALNEGEVTLNQATARFPGGAEVSLFGFLTARGGKPRFDGSLEARADNLRAVLGWLKTDVSSVPVDRLRKFTLSGKVRGDDDQVHLLEANIRLDTSRILGGVTFALRERLAFGASINLNHLNLDAYLRSARPDPGSKPPDDGKRAVTTERSPTGSAAAPPPLALLNDFDANLRLRVGSLTYRGTAAQGIDFDGLLSNGKLTVRQAGVRNLAGTSARVKGTLSNFSGFPVFKGTFNAGSKDLTGLVRIAGLELPVAPRGLGAMKLSGRADADGDKVTLDSNLELAGATIKLTGDVQGVRGAPRFGGAVNISHPEFAELLRAIGHDPGKGVRKLGAFGMSTKVSGDLKRLTLDARAKVAGADISVAGSVSGLAATPQFDLTLKAGHPSYTALLKAFDPAHRSVAQPVGAISVSARIKGDPARVTLGGLKAKLGDIVVSGDGALALDGPRPKLTATLAAGEIFIDPFVAPDAPKGSASQGKTAPAGRGSPPTSRKPPVPAAAPFSNQPFDMSALAPLAALDADLSLTAKALVYRNFRVDKPNIKAVLVDRVMTVSRLAGRMFDGAFELAGTLDANGPPRLDGTVKVTKAKVGKALFQAAQFDILGGDLDFDMAVKAAGRSPRAMAAALGGSGRIAVRNGVVQGFDLRALSDQLKNIDRGLDILKLFGAAMGGGSTRFSSLDGTFRIDKGVLRSDDLRMVAEAGEARAKGSADLPRWTMDFTGEFRLTEHPKAPPFGVRWRGPLDNPKPTLKLEKLQAYLLQRGLQRGVGKLLQGVLPGIRRPPQPAPQPDKPQTQQPQPPPEKPRRLRPEDILRGLLETPQPQPQAQPQTQPQPQPQPQPEPQPEKPSPLRPEDILRGLLDGLRR